VQIRVKNLSSGRQDASACASAAGQLLRAVKQAVLGPLTPEEVAVVQGCEAGAGAGAGAAAGAARANRNAR
jgi:hypothetical protein